ncbi:MAG: helix-hairpin-helix domain-containing protein [Gemmatimonadota bacterium]|nr:MAG: helix-hairpin-helix domain-containing protein [Gemmatimonadota bacterium]
MTLTEGETKALLASSALVLLAAVGRVLLAPRAADLADRGLARVTEVDAVLAVAESIRAEEERRNQPLEPGERIDLNTAAEIELDRLPGIGPTLAQAIVVDRQRRGPYWNLHDLERVPGLGSSTVKRLAPHTTLPAAGRGGVLGTTASRSRPSGPAEVGGVDLNRASVEELQALPGIGPARASAIVRWRGEHGRFRTVEDLLEVPGIGPATLERLRALVRAGP